VPPRLKLGPININFLAPALNAPRNCHSYFLPQLSGTLPVFDEVCRRSITFILSCIFRGVPLVRAVVHRALLIARYNSVIGSNELSCCDRFGWTAADFLAGQIGVSNSDYREKNPSLIIQLVNRIFVLLGLYVKLSVFGKGSFISRQFSSTI